MKVFSTWFSEPSSLELWCRRDPRFLLFFTFYFFFLFFDLRSSDELEEVSSEVILFASGVSVLFFHWHDKFFFASRNISISSSRLDWGNWSRPMIFGQSSLRICLDLLHFKIKLLICSLLFVVTGGIFPSRHSRSSRTSLINLALFTLYDSSAWCIRGVTLLMNWYSLLVENCSMFFNWPSSWSTASFRFFLSN